MKNKKKIIVIVSILVVIISGSLLYILYNKNPDHKKMKVFNKIEKQILNQEDMLIYLTSNNSKCYLCNTANYIFKYYEEMYQLNIFYVNKSKIRSKEYETIIQYIDERENYLKEPALVLIKDGQQVAVANEISSEKDIQLLLTQYGFANLEMEKNLQIDNAFFQELYQKDEPTLVLFQAYTDLGMETRKEILNLSQKYHFNYYIMTDLMFDEESGYRKIYDVLGEELMAPFFVIIGKNEVIDTYEVSKERDLEKFLKKNKIY